MAEPAPLHGDLPTYVYEAYDAKGELLYVGTTETLKARLSSHRASKPWWGEVTSVQHTAHGTRQSAIEAETELIRTRAPKYNVTHSTINAKAESAVRASPALTTSGVTRVQAHRWERGWELHVAGETVTQVGTLDKAEQQFRDYLDTDDPGQDHADLTIVIVPMLGDLGQEVAAVRSEADRAASAYAIAEMKLQRTARRLREHGYSVTDCAAILGLTRSHLARLLRPSKEQNPS